MPVDNKPDPPLNDMTWAESGPNPIPGSQLPTEPQTQLKNAGYGLQLPLPHAQFNWLMRSIMRWIRWLVSKVDNHVHDGQGNPESVPKIAINRHVDWGTGGELQVTSTGQVLHEITHQGTAGTKRIITGQLRTVTIQSNGFGSESSIAIRDSSNNHGFLNSATIQTDAIRSNGNPGIINVRSSNNSDTVLDVNTIQADGHVRTPTIRSATNVLNVRDQTGDGPATINASIIQADDHLRAPTIRCTGDTLSIRSGTDGNATVDANVIQANDHLITPTVRSTGNTLNVRSSIGGNATVDANVIQANDHLITPTVRSIGNTLEIKSNTNAAATLNVNALNSNNVTASTQVTTSTIRATGTGEQATINVRDSNNAHGLLNSAIVQTDEIRRRTNDGIINVRNFGGSNTTMNVATLQTGTIQRNVAGTGTINVRDSNNSNNITLNVSRIQSNNEILMEDQANSSIVLINGSFVNFSDSSGDAFIGLDNAPKYIARIRANGTIINSFLAKSGSVTVEKTAVVSQSGQGEYTFTFPFTNRVAVITLLNARGFVSYDRLSNTQIRVFTTNTSNSFTNQNFAIVVF